jgi:peptide/nickel transport system substrate-binding protein
VSRPLRRSIHRRLVLFAASAAALGLVAGACGSGGGSDSGGTTASVPAGTESAGTTAAPATEAPGSEAPATEAPATTEPAEQPTPGGKVVMGIEADTASPWMPAEMLCAISCHQVIRSVYDPLILPNQDDGWSPYLLESLTPNADYTVWTMKLRPGITFHDGTPLDGKALADNMTRFQKGILTGAYFSNVDTATVSATDPLAVEMKMKSPWVSFPEVLLVGAIDYVASPTWMAAADKDPTLKTKPVGTGPFIFEDYKPNEFFKAKKNPNYWNKPYPYLDEIEFRPIPDALNRRDALKSGTVDIIHSDNGEVIAELRDSSDLVQDEIDNNAEVTYTLLHVTQTLPDGTPSPLTDKRVRCALAYAYDEPTVLATIEGGVFPIANGPFPPGRPGYLQDTGFPQAQDMDKAKQLIADYKKENPGPLNISLATTQDETNLTIAQFQKQWWEEAGVDQVTIDQIDQGTYINTAVLGNFQTFQWRNHGGFDLDDQFIWWDSSSAAPVGQLALNFGRIKDPQIDDLLAKNRIETDPAKKKDYAEQINKIFAEQCYNLWGSWAIWGIAHKPTVHGVENFTLPDGKTSQFGQGISGTFYPLTLWVKQ